MDDFTLPPSFIVEMDDGRELHLTLNDCYITSRAPSVRAGRTCVRVAVPELTTEILEGGEFQERTIVGRGWAYLDEPAMTTDSWIPERPRPPLDASPALWVAVAILMILLSPLLIFLVVLTHQ